MGRAKGPEASQLDRVLAERADRVAADRDRLPGFVIIGAMKCGTTSMRHILAHHPDVFLPQGDISFFDIDEIEQHGDHFVPLRQGWTFHDFENDFDAYYEWYKGFFESARPGQLIGDNSTTYIASRRAPERIAKLLPGVKIVAMLRDPVKRAYSHYWHNLFAGRVTRSFEQTLRYQPGTYFSRGYYREQLARYLDLVPARQLKVILLEEFVRDQQAVVDDLTGFLGLGSPIDLAGVDTHRNPAPAPLSVRGRRLVNRVIGGLVDSRTVKRLPNMPGFDPEVGRPEQREQHPLLAGWVRRYRALRGRRKLPEMKPETRLFLERLYRRQNAGLSELIGRDVAEFWPYMAD
jgi:hypothetical protein